MIKNSYVNKYIAETKKSIELISKTQNKKLNQAADLFCRTYFNNGMIYIFGTGHSHMIAEEGHFRAGGFAPICPILSSSTMLHESATFSSQIERTKGVASQLLDKYNLTSKDIIIIISNSGVNQAPIEAALYAKKRKSKVIGISSLKYSKKINKNKKLYQLSDLHIDNCGPRGDAIISVNKYRVAPFSTIGGAAIINSIISEVAYKLRDENPFPFYISSNMPNSKVHNERLFAKYRSRNPHL